MRLLKSILFDRYKLRLLKVPKKEMIGDEKMDKKIYRRKDSLSELWSSKCY